ncbi:MAG: hypothetical protein RMJ19_05575 [Gemmatales bacterium]|nr:hypothetical protein [Gemmatales bacterium]MDW8175123.1 hypothetical protein [Gemmatales bacterium]
MRTSILITTTLFVGGLSTFSTAYSQCAGGYCVAERAALARYDNASLAATKLEILCLPDDVVEVSGYRLRSTGPKRLVTWDLVPGKQYEVSIAVIRDGSKYERCVTIVGGQVNQVDLRAHVISQIGDETNFGLDTSKLVDKPQDIGGTLTRDDVLAILAAHDTRLRVTIVVPSDQVDKVRKELGDTSDWPALVQVYPPKHWALERAGLNPKEPNEATVFIQTPDGKVLATESYRNPEQVRTLLGTLLNQQPKPQPLSIPWWAWLVAIFAIYWFFFRNRKAEK